MRPELVFKVSPVGSDPTDSFHVYGAVPPTAASCCEYPSCTIPSGNEVVLTDSASPIVIDRDAFMVVLMLALSVNVMVKLWVPAVVGVPLITPVVLLKLSPTGNVPAVTAQA
jgi:hypothetical protein